MPNRRMLKTADTLGGQAFLLGCVIVSESVERMTQMHMHRSQTVYLKCC